MIQKTVVAQRDFRVKKDSILSQTELAGLIARDKKSEVYSALESQADIDAEYTLETLLEALNKLRMEKAKAGAKTSSPWADVEDMVNLLLKKKAYAGQPQLALDMLKERNLFDIAEFHIISEADAVAEVEPEQPTTPTVPEPTEPEKPSGEAKRERKPRK